MTLLYTDSQSTGAGKGLPRLTRALTLTRGDNDGVRGYTNFAMSYCYPGGGSPPRAAPGNPANGATIHDIMENSDGSVVLTTGQTINYAGGGLDFSALTSGANYAQGGADFTTSINTAVSGQIQRFLVCAYIKFPSRANWAPDGQLFRFMQYASVFYSAGPDLFVAEQTNIGVVETLQFRRQVATGPTTGYSTVRITNITMPDWAFDRVIAVVAWRDMSGFHIGIYHPDYGWVEKIESGADASNPANISGLRLKIGSSPVYSGTSLSAFGNAKNMRAYGWFEENLALSGRVAKTVVETHFELITLNDQFS